MSVNAERESYSVSKMPVTNLHYKTYKIINDTYYLVFKEPLPLRIVNMLLRRYEMGQTKYPDSKNPYADYENLPNWTKGHPYSNILDSMGRHLLDLLQGEYTDSSDIIYCTHPDQSHHAASFYWNVFTLVYNIITYKENDLFHTGNIEELEYDVEVFKALEEISTEETFLLFSLLNHREVMDTESLVYEILVLLLKIVHDIEKGEK